MQDLDEESIGHKVGKAAFIVADLIALALVWGNDWMTTSILMPVMLIGLPAGVAVLPILIFGRKTKDGVLRPLFAYCAGCLDMVFSFSFNSVIGGVGLVLGWLAMVPVGVAWSVYTLVVTGVQIARYYSGRQAPPGSDGCVQAASAPAAEPATGVRAAAPVGEAVRFGGATDDGATIVFD